VRIVTTTVINGATSGTGRCPPRNNKKEAPVYTGISVTSNTGRSQRLLKRKVNMRASAPTSIPSTYEKCVALAPETGQNGVSNQGVKD
jgi:hypothetical protein